MAYYINMAHFTIAAVLAGIFTPQWRAKFKEMSIYYIQYNSRLDGVMFLRQAVESYNSH